LEFEVELDELEQSDFEGLGGGELEEEEDVFDDLLEEGVVVDRQFAVDVGRLLVSLHTQRSYIKIRNHRTGRGIDVKSYALYRASADHYLVTDATYGTVSILVSHWASQG
jgi:pyruvate carboxylase